MEGIFCPELFSYMFCGSMYKFWREKILLRFGKRQIRLCLTYSKECNGKLLPLQVVLLLTRSTIFLDLTKCLLEFTDHFLHDFGLEPASGELYTGIRAPPTSIPLQFICVKDTKHTTI